METLLKTFGITLEKEKIDKLKQFKDLKVIISLSTLDDNFRIKIEKNRNKT